MRAPLYFLLDLLWLAGAAACAVFFLKTFLAIEAVSALATFALWRVERMWF